MPDSPRKAPFRCPHCGFVQHEPVHLISTYCRSCGSHYEIASAARGEAELEKKRDSLLKRVTARPPRSIRCHHCERTHEVSGHAKSTICPGCNVFIEMGDLTFSSHVSRPVNTRGKLTIEPGGSLNCASIVCGEAFIEGRINGALLCEGTLRLASSGKSNGQFTAKSIVIEKGTEVELIHTVKTIDLVVYGRARGNFECDGGVLIAKRGVLEGRLVARSVVVERGGILLAESAIQPVQPGKVSRSKPDDSDDNPAPFSATDPLPAY